MGNRQGERLVRQDVRHQRAAGRGHVAQPRREGRRIEEVAGVDERRQQDDRGPGEAAGDVADGGELGRAGEDDDAHRDGFDGRQAGALSGQPVDEAEGEGGDRDPDAVDDEPAARLCELARGQRRKVFPHVPSQTT